MKKKISNNQSNSKLSFSSTFNWQNGNIKQIMRPIDFYIKPFNHFHHKNLNYQTAPFMAQVFILQLENLTNIKYVSINNYTHGSEMTISIAKQQNSTFQQVYQDKFVCKGKTLKSERKDIDIGALPCKAIKIQVNKGSKICSKNISLLGIDSLEIQQKFGNQYFKLLVQNPMRILYTS